MANSYEAIFNDITIGIRKEYIHKLYKDANKLWFSFSENRNSGRGHPGVMGSAGNEPFNEEYGVLMGAIKALTEVAELIKKEKR